MQLARIFGRPLPLFALVAFSSSFVAVLIIALVARSIEIVNTEEAIKRIGQSNATLATEIQSDLSRELFLRYRDILSASQLVTALDRPSIDKLNDWFKREQRAEPGYLWLGVVTPQGDLLTQNGDSGEGRDASHWACVIRALHMTRDEGQFSSTANDCAHSGDRRASLVDLAAPIFDDQGRLLGAMAATISRSWVMSVSGALLTDGQTDKHLQIFGAASDGVMAFSNQAANLDAKLASREASFGVNDYAVLDHWPGYDPEHKMIVGRTGNDGSQRGMLGWTLYVAQDLDVAQAPFVGTHNRIVIITMILALHAVVLAWYMARAISAPLSRLAQSAEALTQGQAGSAIPLISNFAEVEVLSRSLISLVDDLKGREEAQSRLAESLELQVIARTEELAQRNQSLEAANLLADEATRAKTRFLAAASHDLRQPLHALSLFVSALRKRVSGGEAPVLVDQMRQSISQMTRMFDALLHISRLDAGDIAAEMTRVNVGQLISGLTGGFEAEARQRGLTFRFRSADCEVYTDATLLETILRNLVANALKFTTSGGILLAARRQAGRIAIDVYDTGVGIEDVRHESVFQEFERAANDALGHNEGLGLGLSIVKRYARLIDAEIDLRSTPGVGTRFRVLIPEASGAETEQRTPRPQGIFEFKHQQVLLVDDNAIGLQALASNLRDHGAIVFPFETPEAAEEILRQGIRVDLVIADYELGDHVTGLDFIRRNGLIGLRCPASLIITGRTDHRTLTAIESSGVPWLLKPAGPESIAAAFQQRTQLLTSQAR